jgi:beta-lactamase regulating signal transducer with metallopeptidase domain
MSTFFDEARLSAAVWMLLKASALLGTAALVQLVACRRASAATRHFVWTLAVLSMILLPFASFAVPEWGLTVRPALHVAQSPAAANGSPTQSTLANAATPSIGGSEFPTGPRRGSDFAWPAAILAVYIAGTIAMLLLLVVQHWNVRRFARRAAVVRGAEWTRLLDECAGSLRIHRPVRLAVSRDHSVPFALGLGRPAIVIPAAAEGWSEDRRRAVLLHELAHVARYDCLVQTLAYAAGAMYWFHPGVWWVARRLRVERELACDDRVIEAGTAPREYAGHLLDIAYASGGHRSPALAVSMARPHQLEGRMLAALDPARNRTVPTLRSRIAAAMIAAAFVCPMAGVVPAVVAAGSKDLSVQVVGPTVGVPEPALGDVAHAPARAATAAIRMMQDNLPGTWEIRPSGTEGTVHLRLVELNSSSGTNVPIARLEGLTASQLTGSGGPVQFRVRRDAGTFTFEGVVRNGVGAGTFSFAPDSNFAGELAKRGFARPTAREQYQMARHDIGYAFLDELNTQGYAKPETSELVRAGQHGVDASYLREMGALGYRLGSLQPLIELRDHGVTADYVRALAELGYKGLSHEEVRRARDHGVTAEYVRAMRDAGYGSLPMDALVNARDHGITAEYVRELGDAGYRKLPLEELVRVRDHGITTEYVRDMRQLGYGLPVNELVRARDHGITVEFVRDMAALGYGKQSMDALVRVRDHGVTPEYAKDVKALGYENLTLDDLVTLRDHGLTSERIRAANARAGTRLPIDLLKSLAAGGMR